MKYVSYWMQKQKTMLSEERLNQNYLMFINRMEKYGCKSEELLNDLGVKLRYATYNRNEEDGGCYDGALIDVTLNMLCKIGYQINENVFGANSNPTQQHILLHCDSKSLMKVLLLLNVSRAEMYEPETEQWKLKKGMLYRFSDSLNTTLKTGARTIYLCQKYNIKLTEEEFEALLYFDEEDDIPEKFRKPLCVLVRTAIAFTNVELRQIYEENNTLSKNTFEQ